MRKEEIDNILKQRPFHPFEIRLVDGRTYRFVSPDQLLVNRSAIYTLDENQDGLFINLGLIATIHVHDGADLTG